MPINRPLKEKRDEKAIVLQFLPDGDPNQNIKEPIAYVVGVDYYTLLLVTIKPGVPVQPLEELYIGPGKRPKVKSILKRVSIKDLPLIAKQNLEIVLKDLIKKQEKKFVEFFNKAGPYNIKVHTLELLPGIGKTILEYILNERNKKPFESFEDIEKRVKGLKNVENIIYERIIRELNQEENLKLFTI